MSTSTIQKIDEKKKLRSKKPNPLLVLLQRGLYMRQKSVESGTSDQMSPMSGPESPPCWVNTVSAFNRRPSCGSSRCLSCNTESVITCGTCATGTTWSSSCTSWTQPIRGRRLSMDSCQPNTSIFDNDDVFHSSHKSQAEIRHSGRELSFQSLHRSNRRRDSSADTSKDIEDIEDLELDDNDDEYSDNDDNEDVDDVDDVDDESTDIFTCDIETRDKRLHGLMSSPDLAYCSMEGCG